MNHWPFVIASYLIVVIGTAALIFSSFLMMRRTETKASQLKKRK